MAGVRALHRRAGVVILNSWCVRSSRYRVLVMKSWKSLLVFATLLLPGIASPQTASPAEAVALEQQGKLPEAVEAWRAVTEHNPQDVGAFASLGVALARETKYKEAATAYRRAIALNPRLPGIQLNLGLAEYKQGQFQAAIAPLRAALLQDAQNMQARTLLGLSCYGAKRFVEAAKYLEPAAKADPANAELHQVLAQSCLLAKKYFCAQEQFRQILQQNPDSAAAHMLLGQALDGLQRTHEAIAEFEAAAKAAPQEPSVHFGVGYLHWKLRQYDEARTEFDWARFLRSRAAVRKRSSPCSMPRDLIPRNPTPIFAWDVYTRRREIRLPRRRSFLNFANFIKKRTTTLLLKCPVLCLHCRSRQLLPSNFSHPLPRLQALSKPGASVSPKGRCARARIESAVAGLGS